MQEKTILYIILGVVAFIFLSQVFTSKENGTIAFAMPKMKLPKLSKNKKDVADTDDK